MSARDEAAISSALDEALAHIEAGTYDVALGVCLDLVSRFPEAFDPIHLCGYIHQLKGDHVDAVRYFRRAAQVQPENVEVYNNLAASLKALGFHAEAEWTYRQAIRCEPDYAIAHHNLADLLLMMDRPAEAIARARAAIELEPGLADTWRTLGVALDQQRRFDEAIAAYQESVRRGADSRAARYGEGIIRLRRGEFVAGWEGYEARVFGGTLLPSLHERFGYPRWRGAHISDRVLLIVREQGLGDEIMFASCFEDVIPLAKRVLITCDRRLEPLFARSFPAARILCGSQAELDRVLAEERIDFQIPAGSLPLVFRNRLEDFPRRPYLRANPERVAFWHAKLQGLGSGPKIGIAWRGGMPHTGQTRRSLELAALAAPLASGRHLVSLQYGRTDEEIDALRRSYGIPLHHWPEAVDGGDETAALLCALDHVVTVCTAVVHLGGALGVPVSVLVPWVAEWRYGADGDEMPWYGSVRLFRQDTPGAWRPVIERVAAKLPRGA